ARLPKSSGPLRPPVDDDRHVEGLAAPHHAQVEPRARHGGGDRPGQRADALQLRAVDGHHHVAGPQRLCRRYLRGQRPAHRLTLALPVAPVPSWYSFAASCGVSSCMPTPSQPLATWPVRISSCVISFARSAGTARPMPTKPPLGEMIAVFTPTTRPCMSNDGP